MGDSAGEQPTSQGGNSGRYVGDKQIPYGISRIALVTAWDISVETQGEVAGQLLLARVLNPAEAAH